jgi:sugar (pentulose or hexulose) kinase
VSSPPRNVAVIDIGKTNAKVALVERGREKAVRRTPNAVLRGGPYPHYDTERLWHFILGSLAELNREAQIEAICVTTHGATAALIDAKGGLALPILDYEHDGPETLAGEYDAARPPFAETGTPRLPIGLNLGAQLFWQARAYPGEFARTAAILMYPQYWALRLTGARANEVTSLGCHTDLWDYRGRDYSMLVDRMGWRALMAPVRPAAEVLGPILPEIAAAAGLDAATPVHCGIHDSNASLLPHLTRRRQPFSVVSTGTWVIAMAIGGDAVELDPARDTLVNVNAFGAPVPSARFMGGREFEMVLGADPAPPSEAAIAAVLASQTLLMPAVQQGSGPFASRQSAWLGDEPRGGQRTVAASFYLALMTATALGLIGARGSTVVEGPFASNAAFLKMLAAATTRDVVAAGSATGTSVGAALLAGKDSVGASSGATEKVITSSGAEWEAYARRWRTVVG